MRKALPSSPTTTSSLSQPLSALGRTGAFNYAVEFSADSYAEAGRKEWISLNDLAENRDGIIVVSPEWVRQGADNFRSMRTQGRGPRLREAAFARVGSPN